MRYKLTTGDRVGKSTAARKVYLSCFLASIRKECHTELLNCSEKGHCKWNAQKYDQRKTTCLRNGKFLKQNKIKTRR